MINNYEGFDFQRPIDSFGGYCATGALSGNMQILRACVEKGASATITTDSNVDDNLMQYAEGRSGVFIKHTTSNKDLADYKGKRVMQMNDKDVSEITDLNTFVDVNGETLHGAVLTFSSDFYQRNCFGDLPFTQLVLSAIDLPYIDDPLNLLKYVVEKNILTNINFKIDTRKAPASMKSYAVRSAMAYSRCMYRLQRFIQGKKFKGVSTFKQCFAGIQGSTLLHMACGFGSTLPVLEYLIEQGADLEAKNSLGLTPLDMAMLEKFKVKIEI